MHWSCKGYQTLIKQTLSTLKCPEMPQNDDTLRKSEAMNSISLWHSKWLHFSTEEQARTALQQWTMEVITQAEYGIDL